MTERSCSQVTDVRSAGPLRLLRRHLPLKGEDSENGDVLALQGWFLENDDVLPLQGEVAAKRSEGAHSVRAAWRGRTS